MKAAVNEVLRGRPLNVVPREFNIDQMTLKKYCRKKKLNLNESFKSLNYKLQHYYNNTTINYNNKQVFTAEDEKYSSSYLLLASKINCGFSTKSIRLLAYEFALKNKKICPS